MNGEPRGMRAAAPGGALRPAVPSEGAAALPAPPRIEPAGIIANRALASGIRWIDLALPGDWGPPLPGQYVSLALDPPLRETEPGCCGSGLARRPFSVSGFERAGAHARLALLYAPVGRVTRRLAEARPGESIDLLGPLGTAFPLAPEAAEPFLLVGGGRGIAPLLFAAAELARAKRAFEIFHGTRTAAEAPPAERIPGPPVHRSTDDGSLGLRGSVLDLLAQAAPRTGTILACGPHGMLATLAAWAEERGLPCWVSIEENFGCGLGTCGGCAVPAADPPGGYLWACRDGAVLPAQALDWGRWGAPAAPLEPGCGGEA